MVMRPRRWRAVTSGVSTATGAVRQGADQVALALLFASGATLALLTTLLPEPHQVQTAAWAATAASGYPVAALLYLGRFRVPRWALHISLAGGAGLVTLGIYFAHGAPIGTAAPFFYVWVAMYAARSFSGRATVVHVAITAAAYGALLGATSGSDRAGVWVLVMGTAVTVGWVVADMRRQLVAQAETDPLTGLANRAGADRFLAVEISRAHRHNRPLTVAMIDLDGFKAVNDAQGHAAGDRLLVDLGRAWRAQMRASDQLARYGGDEFLLILPDTSAGGADEILERFIGIAGVSFSYGTATTKSGATAASLIVEADRDLYAAKGARAGSCR